MKKVDLEKLAAATTKFQVSIVDISQSLNQFINHSVNKSIESVRLPKVDSEKFSPQKIKFNLEIKRCLKGNLFLSLRAYSDRHLRQLQRSVRGPFIFYGGVCTKEKLVGWKKFSNKLTLCPYIVTQLQGWVG